MKVISTKCAILNLHHRDVSSSPALEVLVLFDDYYTGNLKPKGVICPQYEEGSCKMQMSKRADAPYKSFPCIYEKGWNGFKE